MLVMSDKDELPLTSYWQEAAEARQALLQSITVGLRDVFWIPNKLIYALNPNRELKTLNAEVLNPRYYNSQERECK